MLELTKQVYNDSQVLAHAVSNAAYAVNQDRQSRADEMTGQPCPETIATVASAD